MAARAKTVYRCTECGAESLKWAGKCDSCGEWNTLAEEMVAPKSAGNGAARRRAGSASFGDGGRVVAPRALRAVEGTEADRIKTGLPEFDFVLGGGLVPGSVVLVGGEPGIGKSTILLQVAAHLNQHGHPVLYVSGEESPLQVKLRADRLGGDALDVSLIGETDLESIIASATSLAPRAMVVDSIQTVFTGDLEGAPGSVGQVRECAARLMRFAKETGTAVFVVGHVTKGGGLAGPKTLEHIVDTVVYFEGEGMLDHRILRATKNRFGSVDEIGVFRMTANGLEGVENPSALFLGERTGASGGAVTALIEGSRPMLVEVQALAAKAGFGTPQRVSAGYDGRRLALLLAVLDKRAGLSFAQLDVFVNAVGGVRLVEPSADLAVAAALASSVYDKALPEGAVFLGELGLGGEVRGVTQVERRLAEAERLGMRVAYVGERSVPKRAPKGLQVKPVRDIGGLLRELFR
ncbi:MAG: DNA repair protein RadA [Gemmatimonadaceae bacterium]|nr:DNA repair protein RadA [Gemmatimonadaceae bacterium]